MILYFHESTNTFTMKIVVDIYKIKIGMHDLFKDDMDQNGIVGHPSVKVLKIDIA